MQAEPISFVIPAYNDAQGVRRHLDYFTATARPAELIVVDDASVDGLEQIVADALLPDMVRLRYHRNSENRGPGPSRNTGLKMASAKWLMFLDADDLLVPGFFDYIALAPWDQGADFVLFKHHLCRDPRVLCSYDMHIDDNRFFSNMLASGFGGQTFRVTDIPSVLRIINFPWNKIYRTGFLRSTGIVFPDLRMHEDIRVHWQSCLRAKHFGILNWAPPLIHHIEEPDGQRATNYKGPDRRVAFETLEDVFKEFKTHPLADLMVPEMLEFADDLLSWMIAQAPEMEPGLTEAAERLYASLGQRPGQIMATDMGEILSGADGRP